MEENRKRRTEKQGLETLDLEAILNYRGAEVDALAKMSEKLHSGLSKEALAIIVELIEAGIDPESLAAGNEYFPLSRNLKRYHFCCNLIVVQEIRK